MNTNRNAIFTYMIGLLFFCSTAALAQGPIALLGIDAEDIGHPAPSNYTTLMNDLYTGAANGGSGTLIIGGGKGGSDYVTPWWNALVGTIGPITYVNGAANVAAESFLGYRMIAVVSEAAQTLGGLTDAENEALSARAAEVAAFVNGGGALVGFSGSTHTTPYGYLGNLGTFSFGTPPQSIDVEPTAEGVAVGITSTNLDGCCWHDSYLTFPSFLNVLAYYPVPSSTSTVPAAIGGQQVIVTNNCPYSYGFWKTHGSGYCQAGNNSDFWPASATPMYLGTNTYTAAELCSILHTPPAGGNALLSLAHQLIAAKLNIANGSPQPTPVPATITQADLLIGSLDVSTASVKANTTAGAQMVAAAQVLDMFNNNQIQPPCIPSGASPKRGASADDAFLAEDISIESMYPNPVTAQSTIAYELKEEGRVEMMVYDMLGNRVATLVKGVQSAGTHHARWSGLGADGNTVPNGQYYIRLSMNGETVTRTLSVSR